MKAIYVHIEKTSDDSSEQEHYQVQTPDREKQLEGKRFNHTLRTFGYTTTQRC